MSSSCVSTRKSRGTFSDTSGPTLGVGYCINWTMLEQVQLADDIRAFLTTDPWELFFAIIEPTYLELTLEICSTFHVQDVMTNFDDPGMEFMEDNEINTLHPHIHYSPSKCWDALVPSLTSYDPNRSKASAFSPSLRYNVIIMMANGHIFDLAYFIALAIHHQTEWHRRGVISISPYYRLAQSTDEEDAKDITDDVPPHHKDRLFQPLPPYRPVHAVASYTDISKHLTRFEQQCFQHFNNIDATLQQIFQQFHISLPPPPREPSGDEDV
ncbi:hypothetical protein GOBAR_AA27777 [Gossypium barbadense]|uniref:Uncharacterized protein n=1 Tax=Gossypium barbadense TaxID=3634 RepID=A0A2P5WP75_GOSBA|nr:hypothetical protein GOBAR_AA27777 [Gossypium barbadense]